MRTSSQTLTLNLKRTHPLNDFLLHFIETTIEMGITNPILCRECADIIDRLYQYDRDFAGDILKEGSKEYQRREQNENRKYLTQPSTSIVAYIDPEEAFDQLVYTRYNPKRFIYAEKNRRKITLQPFEENIGLFSPKLILEAYLLYLLHVKK